MKHQINSVLIPFIVVCAIPMLRVGADQYCYKIDEDAEISCEEWLENQDYPTEDDDPCPACVSTEYYGVFGTIAQIMCQQSLMLMKET